MAIENRFTRRKFHLTVIAALFFLFPVSFPQAQDSGYFLDSSGGEIHFIQRLTWIGDEYARRYEVIIEMDEDGEYRELTREFTTALFIEVSLLPGKYRFLVIPYDYLNQSGERSEWMYIEVLAALYPELDDISDLVISGINLRSRDTAFEMRVSGKNLVPGAEIFLLGPEGERIDPTEVHINEDGSEVQILFDKDQLISEDFELIIKNPGGLETSKSGITVVPPAGHLKKINLFLSAAWMPSFTIYDEENRFFKQNMSLLGAVSRFGIVSAIGNYFNFGLELTASYTAFNNGHGGLINLWKFGANLLSFKWLSGERMALAFRLGAGYSLPLSYSNDTMALFYGGDIIPLAINEDTMPPSVWQSINTNIGVSFFLFVFKHLFLEIGLDYAHWFIFPPSGSFHPWIGIGLRL
jgi:hypothetical protein